MHKCVDEVDQTVHHHCLMGKSASSMITRLETECPNYRMQCSCISLRHQLSTRPAPHSGAQPSFCPKVTYQYRFGSNLPCLTYSIIKFTALQIHLDFQTFSPITSVDTSACLQPLWPMNRCCTRLNVVGSLVPGSMGPMSFRIFGFPASPCQQFKKSACKLPLLFSLLHENFSIQWTWDAFLNFMFYPPLPPSNSPSKERGG